MDPETKFNTIHYASLKGRRASNEDRHKILKDNNKNITLFLLNDGHGGSHVSTIVSKILPQYFINAEYPLQPEYVNRLYDRMQEYLATRYNKYAKSCGSTSLAVALFKKNNQLYSNIVNLGDSKCVLCRNNLAFPLTRDHRPSKIEERGRIEKLGGRILKDSEGEWRIKEYSVSRSFGDLNATPFMTHKPDLYQYKIGKNDKFMILGCDGLWDYVSEQEAIDFVNENMYNSANGEREHKKTNIAKMLAEYSYNKGSGDNITAIVVFLK